MTPVLSATAVANLRAIERYIGDHNPTAAESIAAAILERIKLLAGFPAMGRPGRVEGTREFVILGTPYIIVYRARGDYLDIVAVVHGARAWPG
jgi:toxin ParE1/3/4